MSQALSAADRSSLAAEQGSVNMAVGGLLRFDRALERREIVARVAERIHLVPRLRQRLQTPALGLANPVWADDRDFDLAWHVRHSVLPAPGGPSELATLVGLESARRLDRSRPLWELTVIDDPAGGAGALLLRVHHALVDGVGALALGAVLLDPTAEPMEVPAPADPWQPRPFALRRHLARMAAGPISQAQRLMVEGASRALDPDPRRAASELRQATELVSELARNRPQAPATVLNQRLSPNRAYAMAGTDLATIKTAARAARATVNDVLLAVVAGMLRRYLPSSGVPGGRPVALVPVSVRRGAGEDPLGNRISTVLVDLPVDEPEPAGRIAYINAQMTAIKQSPAVRAGSVMIGAAGAAPPLMSAVLARALGGVRVFNLVVSNIPGPQQPLFLNGARLLAAHPVVPLNPANQRLNVGILSYDGRVGFGLLADAALRPPLRTAVSALEQALADLPR